MQNLLAFVFDSIRHIAVGRHLDGMQLAEEVGLLSSKLFDTLWSALDAGTKCLSIQQLVY